MYFEWRFFYIFYFQKHLVTTLMCNIIIIIILIYKFTVGTAEKGAAAADLKQIHLRAGRARCPACIQIRGVLLTAAQLTTQLRKH